MKAAIYCRVGNKDQLSDCKDRVNTICYGKREVWDSREEAKNFFQKAMAFSEGSERNRYEAIYTQLKSGYSECRDVPIKYTNT